jgi:hypothetical protein
MLGQRMTNIPHVRTSERRDFKRCQQRWDWAWRKGLKSRTTKPDALWFGIGIHLALQERYKYQGMRRGKNVLGVWRDYVGDEIVAVRTNTPGEYESEEPAWMSAGELGEIMLGEYLDKYGMDERWYVISAEQTFEIPIPRPDNARQQRPAGPLVYYNGTFDLVALDQNDEGALWLWDHKTAKQIQTGHLSLDDQAGSYWAVAGDVLSAQGLIQPGQQLNGIMYNFLRKGKPDERETNAAGQALNKPGKDDYIKALLNEFDAKKLNASQVPGLKLDKTGELKWPTIPILAQACADNGIKVEGAVSLVQPSALFLREEVYRTRSERRRQIEKIQNEALQMEAVRSRVLPLTKNPTKDCQFDCAFFQMCELHEMGSDWQEFRNLSFTKRDPYSDHRKSADAP